MSVVRFLATRVPFSRASRPFSTSVLSQKSLTDSVKETAENVSLIVILVHHRWDVRLRSSTRRLDRHSRAALILPKRPLRVQRTPSVSLKIDMHLSILTRHYLTGAKTPSEGEVKSAADNLGSKAAETAESARQSANRTLGQAAGAARDAKDEVKKNV